VLDNNVVIYDAELSPADNFNGTSLTLARNGGANNQDLFSATGLLGALVEGGSLVFNGTTIGTVTTNSGGTLVVTFNANATNTLVNSAMRAIAYANSSDDPPAAVQIDWTFSDGNTGDQGAGGALTAIGSTTVNITAVNDAPVQASIEGTALAYTENEGAIAITSTLSISDVDDTHIESAVVAITGNYANGQDVLSFTNQNGISGSWNATTGELTLTGSATLAQYEAALRSITYINTSDDPSTATRTVSFTVNDGDANSNTQTRDIAIAAVNDAPTFTSGSGPGWVVTQVSSFWDGASDVTVQSDGKIVVAGALNNGSNTDSYIARYHADGTLDLTFGDNGVVILAVSASNDALTSVAVQNDGKIVATGYARNGIHDDFAVVRLNSDGSLDSGFGTGGVRLIDFGGQNDRSESDAAG
jgi:uncharacterized delta-60 repeat protein